MLYVNFAVYINVCTKIVLNKKIKNKLVGRLILSMRDLIGWLWFAIGGSRESDRTG